MGMSINASIAYGVALQPEDTTDVLDRTFVDGDIYDWLESNYPSLSARIIGSGRRLFIGGADIYQLPDIERSYGCARIPPDIRPDGFSALYEDLIDCCLRLNLSVGDVGFYLIGEMA